MIGKKINQLATELAPVSTDLTIIGDPISGVSKKITLAQLGAIFSGAVSFYTDLASFPATGDINVIYCAKDTQKLYLWSGSAYTEVFPSQALLDTYQLRSEKGNANGYASLDSLGKVPISQLPSSLMEYLGTWNAATNTPTLANGTGDNGDVYLCNVAGTVNFGAGPITFSVGDWVIYNGTIWERSSGSVGTVTSVALTFGGDAISVSGSPLTTSGTLGLTFNGTTAQYIRGNGTLETFPTSLISGTGNVNAIPKFTANTVLGNSVMEDDGNFVSMRGLKINAVAGVGNTINFQQGSGITAAGLGYSTIGAASTTGFAFYIDQNTTSRSFILDTSTITSATQLTYSLPASSGTLALTSDIPSLTGYVPYTGATANLDLGTHTLIAAKGTFSSSGSGDTVGITHSSGSGIALNITKGGNGEGLYINKTSGSGNAATIIGTLNATTLVKSGGTSSQFLKADGSVDSTSYGTGSVTSVGLSSATSGVTIGSTPITTSGTITLAIATASGSQQGLLSSTDWTTFNNKQNALTNPVTGTGTTNYLPKFTGASTIGNSVIYETSGGNIGIGTITPDKASWGSKTLTIEGSANPSIIEIGRSTSTTSGNIGIVSFYNSGTYAEMVDLISYADGAVNSGGFKIATMKAGVYDTRLTLNSSGNLGLGVTPSAWALYKAIQVQGASIANFDTSDNSIVGSNVFYGGSPTDFRYISTGTSTMYRLNGGAHYWFQAPSGTAGNAISFTQAMTLNASGNLSLGNTNDTYKLDVTGTGRFTGKTIVNASVSNDVALDVVNTNTTNGYGLAVRGGVGSTSYALNVINAANTVDLFTVMGSGAATFSSTIDNVGNITSTVGATNTSLFLKRTGNTFECVVQDNQSRIRTFGASGNDKDLLFDTDNAGTTRLFIKGSNGNVGIGTSSPTTVGSYRVLEVAGPNTSVGGMYRTQISDASIIGKFYSNSTGVWLSSETSHPLILETANTERMRITSGGDIGIGNTGDASVRLFVSGKDTSSNNYAALFRNSSGSNLLGVKNSGRINMGSLPTSSAGLSSGDLYVAAGVLMIV
jgi:hypothetical protein